MRKRGKQHRQTDIMVKKIYRKQKNKFNANRSNEVKWNPKIKKTSKGLSNNEGPYGNQITASFSDQNRVGLTNS